jgi:hypothetical protein
MYSGYDVNCVKVYVTILGIVTLLLNLNVILSYSLVCGASFYQGVVFYDAQGNYLPPDTPDSSVYYQIQFDWQWGWGFIILVTATALKALDVIFNCCIPTPNVTRDRREQEIYESIGAEDMEAMKNLSPPLAGSSNNNPNGSQ